MEDKKQPESGGFKELLGKMMARRWFITALVLGSFMLIIAGIFTAITYGTPIAGEWKAMCEMFINVYLMCQGSPSMTPDQAALNVTLSLEPFKSITKFSMSEDSWACQAGTTVDPIKLKQYGDKLVEPSPYLA